MSEYEWMQKFGRNLKAMLEDAWTSQSQLAADTGLSDATISRYINGLQIPTVKAVINICYALDCGLDELIDFGEPITD